jgi:uncharacterized protein YciW
VNFQQQRSPRGLVSIDSDPKAIPPKRTYRSARYFSRAKFARLCLEALRKAGAPITTAEIVASVIAANGLPENLAANLPEKNADLFARQVGNRDGNQNRHNARCQIGTNGPKEQLKFWRDLSGVDSWMVQYEQADENCGRT